MSEFKIESIPGREEGTRILRLTGPFTLQQVFEFQAILRGGTDPITIIDLTGVPYMDSASLGAIMGAHVLCHKHQRKYALVGVSERLRMLFEVGGVEKLLVIYPTAEEAQLQLATGKAAGGPA
jgi:anti-sigma B factor antagonist